VPPAAPGGERFRPQARLRRSTDFQRCYRQGRRRGGAYATVHLIRRAEGGARLGVTVSRRVGGAVVRNRLKRWSRELFRRAAWRRAIGDADLVIHYKLGSAVAQFDALRAEIELNVTALAAASERR